MRFWETRKRATHIYQVIALDCWNIILFGVGRPSQHGQKVWMLAISSISIGDAWIIWVRFTWRCYPSNRRGTGNNQEAQPGLDLCLWVSLHPDYNTPRLASQLDFIVMLSTHPGYDVERFSGFGFFG